MAGAKVSTTQQAIEPGSIPYGGRQQMEAAISGVLGGGGGGTEGTPVQNQAVPPGPSDPLGLLLSGQLPQSGRPLTDGMSVGPGAGPMEEQALPSSTMAKLQYIAQYAKTPHLRAQARNALRRVVRTGDLP